MTRARPGCRRFTVLHSGRVKLKGDAMFAQGVHAVFCGTYPALKAVRPSVLLKTLAITEMTVGSGLLLPHSPRTPG
jgi:hypothetical protein